MLVSCIMPTRSRQEFAAVSLQCFLSQTHPDRELVVMDDADDPSFPQGIDHTLVRYHRQDRRLTIPDKRNRLCSLAAGPVIAHWDSDDWYHPGRLTHQVKLLQESGKSVVGYRSMLFYGPGQEVHRYSRSDQYGLGTSLMYRRAWWACSPFKLSAKTGEDSEMVGRAMDSDAIVSVRGDAYIVARIHSGNTAIKNPNSGGAWHKAALEDLPVEFPR